MTYTLNGKEILAVVIEEPKDSFADYFFIGTDGYLYANYGQIDIAHEKLPEGSWSILGRGRGLNEEQWQGLVGELTLNGKDIIAYESYGFGLPKYDTATASGLSWLKANGIDENYLLIIKN